MITDTEHTLSVTDEKLVSLDLDDRDNLVTLLQKLYFDSAHLKKQFNHSR
jgi:hypothetical protein